jgi:folate-dependent phosphoribosylglycinamide formyltransferase PurN
MERWRLAYDRAVMAALADYQADLAVLAGYMLIVGPEMCASYTMINLHPALPGGPTGTWQQVIRQLIDEGAAVTGAMMHLVTPELDRGPAISYFTFPIRGGFDDIRADGAARELPLILATITAFADGRLRVDGWRVFAGDREITSGYDLSVQVDDWLAAHGE